MVRHVIPSGKTDFDPLHGHREAMAVSARPGGRGPVSGIAPIILAVSIVLALARPAQAQAPAVSLEELKKRAKIGETLLLVDEAGLEVKGTLVDLSAAALTLKLYGMPRTYAAERIRRVQRPDTLWKGVLIGAAVGTGLAIWDYSIDPSEPGNAAISVVAIGGGALIGAGIDAMIGGPKTLFVRRLRVKRGANLSVAPVLSAGRRGVSLSLGF